MVDPIGLRRGKAKNIRAGLKRDKVKNVSWLKWQLSSSMTLHKQLTRIARPLKKIVRKELFRTCRVLHVWVPLMKISHKQKCPENFRNRRKLGGKLFVLWHSNEI